MRETVVIKGNKSGMTVILDDQVPFDELLLHVGEEISRERPVLGLRTDDTLAGGAAFKRQGRAHDRRSDIGKFRYRDSGVS